MKAVFWRQEKSSAYIWVITLTLALLCLAWIFMSLTSFEVRKANSLVYSLTASSLAESAAEYGVSVLYPYVYNLAAPDYLPPPETILGRAQKEHSRPFGSLIPSHSYTLDIWGPVQVGSKKYRYYVDATSACGRAVRRARITVEVGFENGASQVAVVERRQL